VQIRQKPHICFEATQRNASKWLKKKLGNTKP
jgi:hypothetical protein